MLAKPLGNPLLSWGFLALLEDSGSVCPQRGWLPQHLELRRDGRLIAAAPFYIKAHSWGEFVFDQGFAQFAEGQGLPWYPKLVGMVPLSPCPAWRILCADAEDQNELEAIVLHAALERARELGLTGLHILWPQESWRPQSIAPAFSPKSGKVGAQAGMPWRSWSHQSYLWENRAWTDYPAYLASLNANARRNILREGRGLAAAGVETRIVEADEAAGRPELLQVMADFYLDTNERFGPMSARFLEPDFFRRLPEYLASGWFLSAAFPKGQPLARPLGLALLFEGQDRLYGRYWGREKEEKGMHFELCYNLPIRRAIERGISSFDPGMGGDHKARRGFASALTDSFHIIFNPLLDDIFRRSVAQAAFEEGAWVESLNRELPWKKV